MNGTLAVRGQHAGNAMAAQNARTVSGLAIAWVVIRMAVPLDGVRAQVVVGRLNDGKPGDRRKLQEKRSGGGSANPQCVGRPRHAWKVSAGDRSPTRLLRRSCLTFLSRCGIFHGQPGDGPATPCKNF